jgi:CRP-like cAMP-binding protein
MMAIEDPGKARRSKATTTDPRQLGLFEAPTGFPPPSPAPAVAPAPPPPPQKAAASPARISQRVRRPTSKAAVVHTVVVEDLPNYPVDLIEMVDAQIKTIPTDRVLLTYREIHDYFGVSRATVIRRLKDGLVPGIRIVDGRVMDDGPVRRLDRIQVRWLLLSVRAGR